MVVPAVPSHSTEPRCRLAKRMVELRGDRPGGHGIVQRVLPEIAHQAMPWAFLVGEKNRQAIDEVAAGRALFL